MTHINEDKRRTEGQVVLFDIFNDIDNCPVSIAIIKLVIMIFFIYQIYISFLAPFSIFTSKFYYKM